MKNERQLKIIELIKEYEIDTQEELAARLQEEGIHVTQATVSRDIRELKLTKMATAKGRQKYTILAREEESRDKHVRILKEGFVGMDEAAHLLVIKTGPGMAMAAAAAIDAIGFEDLIGCIAGDDTVFCAVKRAESVEKIRQNIRMLLG
ncbi:MAG: arginine repressor [Johnsonella sp.]|nr:arginine repressor [Johnsonella sp.]